MRTVLILAAFIGFSLPAASQTVGIPGFNGYTINSLIPGSPPCTALTFATPIGLDFEVSASGNGYLCFLLASPAPCAPNFLPLLTCQGTTLDLAFPIASFASGLTGSGGFGVYLQTVFIPPLATSVTFSTQAVIFDPACSGLPLFTQAYDVTLTP